MAVEPDRTRLPLVARRPNFERRLALAGHRSLRRSEVLTLQINLGKKCNMACLHCHVEAGPKRTEIMQRDVAERVVELLRLNPAVRIVDLTGGAPELNPNFRWLVEQAQKLGRCVIDRCNLSVLLEPGMEDMAEFLAGREVKIVASLPCYQSKNVERQRGKGAFEDSIAVLKRLNGLGYGRQGSNLELDLVYNPVGASLPPPQAALEQDYRRELRDAFGIEFTRLITITNMPIKRFGQTLEREGKLDDYAATLERSFNPQTVDAVMCRSLLSVGYDGQLYDCDFNQMLDLPLGAGRKTVWDVESFDVLEERDVTTDWHCFGCTAGSGSSCSGALS